MPGARPVARASAPSAWQAQHHLTQLQAAIDVLPDPLSLPGHLRTATDTALRCLNADTSAPSTSTQTPTTTPTSTTGTGLVKMPHQALGTAAAAAAAAVAPSAAALAAAARHLEATLHMVPSHMGHMAHSLAHAFLFLSTPEVREAMHRLGAVTDDLALPYTWRLDLPSYLQLVRWMGWDQLLLDSLALLSSVEAASGTTAAAAAPGGGAAAAAATAGSGAPRTCTPASSRAAAATAAGQPGGGQVVLQLLEQLLAAGPDLSLQLLDRMWVASLPGAPTEAAEPAPGPVVHMGGWRATHVVLKALCGWMGGEEVVGREVEGMQLPRSCLSLCACVQASLSAWQDAPAAPATATASSSTASSGTASSRPGELPPELLTQVTRGSLLALEHHLQLLQQHWPALSATAPAAPGLVQLHSQLKQLAASAAAPAASPTFPAGELFRLKCRLALFSPTLEAFASGCSPEGAVPIPTGPIPPSFMLPCNPDQQQLLLSGPGDVWLQALGRSGFASGVLLVPGAPASTWQAALKPVVPAQSQHGLPTSLIQALQSLADNPPPDHTDSHLTGVITLPTPSPLAVPSSTYPAVAAATSPITPTASAAATAPTGTASCPTGSGAWSRLQRESRLPASHQWEQLVTGWLLAGLTPGLPCVWAAVNNPAAAAAAGAGCYAPMRLSLALAELAACIIASRAGGTRFTATKAISTSAAHATESISNGNGISSGNGGTSGGGAVAVVPDAAVGSDSAQLLGVHPLLADVLLCAAASAMQLVTQPAQQLVLQRVVQANPLMTRLVQHLSASESHTRGSASALVTLSNRLVTDSATQQGAPVALGAHSLAKLVAAAACEVLPFAVLSPQQLLRRAVADCVQHPGQLPFWLQLLSGPLRPTAIATATPLAALPPPASPRVALVVAVDAYVSEASSGSGALPDGQLRALGRLLAGCMASGGAAHAHELHMVGLVDVGVMVEQLVVPLLRGCARPELVVQARTALTVAGHVLSAGPNPGGHAATTGGAAGPYPAVHVLMQRMKQPEHQHQHNQHQYNQYQHHRPPQQQHQQQGLASGVAAAASSPLVQLLLAACAVLQQLRRAALEGGPLHTSSIELVVELVERSVTTAAAEVARPGFPPQVAYGMAQALMAGCEEVRGEAGLMEALLPLLQACVDNISRRAEHTHDTPHEGDDQEDQVAALSSRLLRALLPATAARPSAASGSGGAALQQQQLSTLFWFTASAGSHAAEVVASFLDWARGELEELTDDAPRGGGEEVVAVGTAVGVLEWSHRQVAREAWGAHAGAGKAVGGGVARTVACSLQRQLVRGQRGQLAAGLVQALAQLLPVMAGGQAARMLHAATPAIIVCMTAQGGTAVQSWADAQVQLYSRPGQQTANQPAGADGGGDVFAAAVASLMQGGPGAATGAAGGGTGLDSSHQAGLAAHVAYIIHVMCDTVVALADTDMRQATHRCLQHLVALASSCLTGADSEGGDSSSRAAAAAVAAALHQQQQPSSSQGRAWCVALLVLPGLLGCWQRLVRLGEGLELLQVVVLQALRVLLQARLHTPAAPAHLPDTTHATGATSVNAQADADTGPQVTIANGNATASLDAPAGGRKGQQQVVEVWCDDLGMTYAEVVRRVGCVLGSASQVLGGAGQGAAGGLLVVHLAASQLVEQHVAACCGEEVDVEAVVGGDLDDLLMPHVA